jgi:hypothetical protein
MRIFRLSRDTQSSTMRRVVDAVRGESAPMSGIAVAAHATHLEKTDEMPIVRDLIAVSAEPRGRALIALDAPTAPTAIPEVVEGRCGSEEGDSDVFVCRRSSPELTPDPAAVEAAAQGVTLFVYGWENVEPGPLSWAFPSLRTALDAVRTMRNAVAWCIASGSEWSSMDAARAEGAVLIEQNV